MHERQGLNHSIEALDLQERPSNQVRDCRRQKIVFHCLLEAGFMK